MDLFGTKLLVVIVLTILIVFSGAVPPAYKKLLDTWYGRIAALLAVLMITNVGGWPLGILAVVAALTLMPVGVREGFEGDKLQVVPAERRQRWFIERVMQEDPVEIETNNVETLPTQ